MKIFVATIIVCLTFYIIKVDLLEGTIPLAYSETLEEKCVKDPSHITVEILPGDTIYSLFALYPTSVGSSITFTERLKDFYTLNPHLVNQSFLAGEKVLLPLYVSESTCK